jgi:hypothetical protein
MTEAFEAEVIEQQVDIAALKERFRLYRDPPDEKKISLWFEQFNASDRGLLSKLLSHVTVIGEADIQVGYRDALESLEGWNSDPAKRAGRWFFVGFGKPSESGPAMLRSFRDANALGYSRFDSLFQSLVDLPSLRLTANDHVVFIDDFAGSGKQVGKMWPRVAELVASEAKCYLVLTSVTDVARQKITTETELSLVYKYELGPDHLSFDERNENFSPEEKVIVEKYCAIAEPSWPKGFGNLGVLSVLSHKTQNNCLPIIYVNEDRWMGLLPRYLKAA